MFNLCQNSVNLKNDVHQRLSEHVHRVLFLFCFVLRVCLLLTATTGVPKDGTD